MAWPVRTVWDDRSADMDLKIAGVQMGRAGRAQGPIEGEVTIAAPSESHTRKFFVVIFPVESMLSRLGGITETGCSKRRSVICRRASG